MNREEELKERKDRAKVFLQSLKKELTSNMLPPTEMRAAVREVVKNAKDDAKLKHMRSFESAFLNKFAIPMIHCHMQTEDGIGKTQATQAFLAESHKNMPHYASWTPARTRGHPFTKIVGAKPAGIMAQWRGKHGPPLIQACPDFAFREPFPYKIVFEGKYFERGGAIKAQTELVTDIYQAFYYRGLPYVPAKKKNSPAWDYEFACLLAYDASEDGSLKTAWDDLAREVKSGFWGGANVFVMILQGAKKTEISQTVSEQVPVGT